MMKLKNKTKKINGEIFWKIEPTSISLFYTNHFEAEIVTIICILSGNLLFKYCSIMFNISTFSQTARRLESAMPLFEISAKKKYVHILINIFPKAGNYY